MPFIQSVYCASVLTSSRGSACAANVASGAQNARQTSHPRPASQAAKKASATLVIDAIPSLLFTMRAHHTPRTGGNRGTHLRKKICLAGDVDDLPAPGSHECASILAPRHWRGICPARWRAAFAGGRKLARGDLQPIAGVEAPPAGGARGIGRR